MSGCYHCREGACALTDWDDLRLPPEARRSLPDASAFRTAMDVRILLIGLILAAVWPFILVPRRSAIGLAPVARHESSETPSCYYFSFLGESLSTECPPHRITDRKS